MDKVIVFDMSLTKGIIAEGTTDGKIVDQHYLRVAGELYHYGCVMKDTSEARCALELAIKTNKAAEEAVTYAKMLSARLLRHYKVV